MQVEFQRKVIIASSMAARIIANREKFIEHFKFEKKLSSINHCHAKKTNDREKTKAFKEINEGTSKQIN